MIALYIVLAVIAVISIIAVIKKPGSIYKNEPKEKNPMEGKTVRFVVNYSERKNLELSMVGGLLS